MTESLLRGEDEPIQGSVEPADDPIVESIAAPRRKRGVLILIAILVFGVGLAILAYWIMVGRFWESTDNAYIQADSVVISPKVAGYVTEVEVGDNQTVAAKDLLVRIDAAPYQAAADLAEAQVAAAQADLVRDQADIKRQQSVVEEKSAEVSMAGTAAQLAASDAGRVEQLAHSGVATAERSDTAIAQREMARSKVLAARADSESASREEASLEAQLGQGAAALRAAEARLSSARTDLEGASIASPIAGVVGDRSARVGQYVQPGTRLMTVVPSEGIYLLANFKETQLRHMRVGQPAEIQIDALDGPVIKGVVDSLAPGTGAEFALLPPENATGNFTKIIQRVPVRIRLELSSEQRALLRPGLSAEVQVDTHLGRAP